MSDSVSSPASFTLTAVMDDKFADFFQMLGELSVTRASEVEWEDGEWVARLKRNGRVIARGKDRKLVIQREVEFINMKLKAGEQV